jgi:hypothetical protein
VLAAQHRVTAISPRQQVRLVRADVIIRGVRALQVRVRPPDDLRAGRVKVDPRRLRPARDVAPEHEEALEGVGVYGVGLLELGEFAGVAFGAVVFGVVRAGLGGQGDRHLFDLPLQRHTAGARAKLDDLCRGGSMVAHRASQGSGPDQTATTDAYLLREAMAENEATPSTG